jgi:hypothetical protein
MCQPVSASARWVRGVCPALGGPEGGVKRMCGRAVRGVGGGEPPLLCWRYILALMPVAQFHRTGYVSASAR